MVATAQRVHHNRRIDQDLTPHQALDSMCNRRIQGHQIRIVLGFWRHIGLPGAGGDRIALLHQQPIAEFLCRDRGIRPLSQIEGRQRSLAPAVEHVV